MQDIFLNTQTIYRTNQNTGVGTINLFYSENSDCLSDLSLLPNTLASEIKNIKDAINLVSSDVGNLNITMNDQHSEKIDFFLDKDAHLYIKSDNVTSDEQRYQIDNNGHLIYDFCQ